MPVRLAVIALIAALTLSCGWQLRGSVALSNQVESLHLTTSDDYGPLMVTLHNRLSGEGVLLTEGPIGAQYTLQITRENTDKRVAAVGSDALANAYDLTLSARFNVLDASGNTLAGGLNSSVSRSYNASSGSSGSQEEALLVREMRAELAQQILRQLQAAINAAQARGLDETGFEFDPAGADRNGETAP